MCFYAVVKSLVKSIYNLVLGILLQFNFLHLPLMVVFERRHIKKSRGSRSGGHSISSPQYVQWLGNCWFKTPYLRIMNVLRTSSFLLQYDRIFAEHESSINVVWYPDNVVESYNKIKWTFIKNVPVSWCGHRFEVLKKCLLICGTNISIKK